MNETGRRELRRAAGLLDQASGIIAVVAENERDNDMSSLLETIMDHIERADNAIADVVKKK